MNHAFLIIAHDQPELLKRALHLLESPSHYFFVMIDSKSKCREELIRTSNSFHNTLYTSILKMNWGGYSLVKAECILLNSAYKSQTKFDYFQLMSGADFPCCSNREFDQFFERAHGTSWLAYDPIQDVTAYQSRINRFYMNYFFNTRYGRWNRLRIYAERIINSFVHRKALGLELHKGTQWFSLHHTVVAKALDFLAQHPKYAKRFKFSYCADELFFHTMLYPYLEDLNINHQTHLRYINWHPKRPYVGGLPLTLEAIDFDDIMSHNVILCRKIKLEQSAELLNMIERHIKS